MPAPELFIKISPDQLLVFGSTLGVLLALALLALLVWLVRRK